VELEANQLAQGPFRPNFGTIRGAKSLPQLIKAFGKTSDDAAKSLDNFSAMSRAGMNALTAGNKFDIDNSFIEGVDNLAGRVDL